MDETREALKKAVEEIVTGTLRRRNPAGLLDVLVRTRRCYLQWCRYESRT